jgi:hypothetical protein
METSQALEKILPAFEQYYTVNKESNPPFSVQADFRSHNEQYFLVRSAHIADIDSNEFVYFATSQSFTKEELEDFSKQAWERGLSKVKPYNGHRNSDITLIIFADKLAEDKNQLIKQIKKTKLYKSYKFSFHGWSNFKLAVVDLETQDIYFNRFGKDYRKLIEKNIFQK